MAVDLPTPGTPVMPTRKLAAMSDEDVIEALTKVKGIGRWTAEMFLIFTLNRPDVLPVDDLGLQQGAQKIFGLKKTPDKKALTKLAEPWRPWRSIATWYIWRASAKMVAAASPVSARPTRQKKKGDARVAPTGGIR